MGKIILFNYKLKIINNLWKLLSITYSLKFFLFYNESLHACNDLLNHELSIYIEILQLQYTIYITAVICFHSFREINL